MKLLNYNYRELISAIVLFTGMLLRPSNSAYEAKWKTHYSYANTLLWLPDVMGKIKFNQAKQAVKLISARNFDITNRSIRWPTAH